MEPSVAILINCFDNTNDRDDCENIVGVDYQSDTGSNRSGLRK